MICRSCLRRASTLRPISQPTRAFSSRPSLLTPASETATPRTSPPPATSSSIAQPFSTPLSPAPNEVSLGQDHKLKPKTPLPVSTCPAGTPLKGLNYFKGKEDIVALAEEEYPEWLWRCLDVKETEEKDGANAGDEFSKSKKLRRKAAKSQRKLEAKLLASGDLSSLQPKIPITKQSVDLPSNEEMTLEGALRAGRKREELRNAMRAERRSKIKETNYLKAM